ncbi:hypothetical protein [Sandaracinus amylolyticus]|uniref:Putative inner membrane protein n=1 Tax=Sandaracinus amylolyticus TaxID=927083 RepID=A0A0F6W0V8_9BACT|nr:hypothetical protein [Sandaracinus amylolyticus]AKF04390.1 putative inner membrane protein [Sandaracinus amylolyticus]
MPASTTRLALLYGTLLAGHALNETARDALYLARHPPGSLPAVYVALAFVVGAVSWVVQRIPDGSRPARRIVAILALGALVSTSFAIAAQRADSGWSTALYVWSGVFGMISTSSMWAWMSAGSDVGHARRDFARIGVGGLLGAIVGSLAAAAIGHLASSAWSLIAAACALALAAIGVAWTARREPAVIPEGRAPSAGSVRAQARYAMQLFVFVSLGAAVLTAGDLVFKATIAEHTARGDLAAVFGVLSASTSLAALVVQLALTPFLLRRFGLQTAMIVLPASLGAFVAIGIGGAPALAAVGLRASAGALQHSLHGTATELLFMPFELDLRRRLKLTFQTVGHRAGQALGALTIALALALGGSASSPAVLAIVLGLALLWIAVAVGTHRRYLTIFRSRLDGFEPDPRIPLPSPALGAQALETVLRSLSLDATKCLSALRLLERHGRAELVPTSLLAHPSTAVVLATTELLVRADRTDASAHLVRLLARSDDVVRARAAAALLELGASTLDVEPLLADRSAAVRAVARVVLATRAGEDAAARLTELVDAAESADPETRIAILRALAHAPARPELDVLVTRLVARGGPEIADELATLAISRPHRALAGVLVDRLSARPTRAAVHQALVAIGDAGLEALVARIGDAPRAMRLLLPDAIAAHLTPRAGAALRDWLDSEDDGAVRYRILRAMGRFAREGGPLPHDVARTMDRLLERTLRRLVKLASWRAHVHARYGELARTDAHVALLDALLLDKQRATMERAFRVIGLRGLRGEDPEVLFRGLRAGDRTSRESARELLDHALDGRVRDALLALTDDDPVASQASRAAAALGVTLAIDPDAIERELAADGSDMVRRVAARAAGRR